MVVSVHARSARACSACVLLSTLGSIVSSVSGISMLCMCMLRMRAAYMCAGLHVHSCTRAFATHPLFNQLNSSVIIRCRFVLL